MQLQRLREKTNRAKKEKSCATNIQRCCRGCLGRKAAHIWRVKFAEIKAVNALVNAATTAIKRNWRVHVGRQAAKASTTVHHRMYCGKSARGGQRRRRGIKVFKMETPQVTSSPTKQAVTTSRPSMAIREG